MRPALLWSALQLNRNEVVVVLSIRLVFESLACKEGILVGFSAKKILEHFRGVLKKKEELQKKRGGKEKGKRECGHARARGGSLSPPVISHVRIPPSPPPLNASKMYFHHVISTTFDRDLEPPSESIFFFREDSLSFHRLAPVVQTLDSAIHRISNRDTNSAIYWIEI